MKHLLSTSFLVPALVAASATGLHAQEALISVSGTVREKATGEPLPGVSIIVKGGTTGTLSDGNGQFALKAKLRFPFTLVFNTLGYESRELEIASGSQPISVQLESKAVSMNEVVVSASRVEESRLTSPVAIEKLDIRAIKETPAPSFYDALENVKGVQMTTSSLTFKVPNTRGFNIPNNFRFMQLVDGVDMQAATLGVPLGNAIGPTELDVASVEITPGAASALYGMNAINGMANLTTKSPFNYQGLSVYQKVGVNHVDGTDRNPSVLTETAVRWAQSLGTTGRWAYKVNGSFLRGTDWLSNTQNDQNPQNLSSANPRFPELSGPNNPAADLWNRYGDDNAGNVSITIPYQGRNETFNVRRTGYYERDLVNPIVRNIKADASLHYKLTEKLELSYGYRFGLMDGVFQRGNKIQLDGVTVQNHKLELKGENFTARAYMLVENTGNSYNLNPLALNLDLQNGTTGLTAAGTSWGDKFRRELLSQVNGGTPLAQAMQQARVVADAGRAVPGTPAFDALKAQIVKTNNWDSGVNVPGAPIPGGAALTQRSRTYHSDAIWNLGPRVKFADVLLGADARLYEVIPDGNNFVDFSRPLTERTQPGGQNQYYKKIGGFGQATKRLLQDRLKLTASLRLDYNPEFAPKLNPRVAAVYTAGGLHNFRASYQNGWRFPSLFEALSFVNNGNVRRVGGLARVNEGLNYLDNSYTLASISRFNAAVNAYVAANAGTTASQAALRPEIRGVLQVGNLPTEQPEQINAYEVGYRSVLLDNRLSIDADAYVNIYSGFLGQVEVSVPKNAAGQQVQVGSDDAVLAALNSNRAARQDRYRVYTNARNNYHSYGSTLGATYNFYQKYTVGGNVSYNALSANNAPDIFVTGFNTPHWVTNVSFGNREIVRNVGFNLVWRHQSSFVWESPLANGRVPAYQNLDAQVNVRVPALKSTVKVGGTNLLNNRYIQYAAGPTIGGLYYVALTFDNTVLR
ncbi:TonB-dependent receptor [Hymenobacter canadensis]|uniref:Carboxypeptidase-like regulatory domain-containing protein n=1 Tax=Hymenobacter canadensis TaxID=2999067 RepID=A0ABY7LUB9_9BACT|nr:TonB-dependent receptor [Hymenobacter canadensis]WBA43527.1 carboxypeptidase-like regulatory domain-containing protein [Hymenobacter canadensis]